MSCKEEFEEKYSLQSKLGNINTVSSELNEKYSLQSKLGNINTISCELNEKYSWSGRPVVKKDCSWRPNSSDNENYKEIN